MIADIGYHIFHPLATYNMKNVPYFPLWNGNEQTLAVRLPVNEHLYYLIENPQQRGVDRYLPSEGVLILQVDEWIAESLGPVRVVNGHPNAPHFEEAPFKAGERYENLDHGLTVNVLKKNAKM